MSSMSSTHDMGTGWKMQGTLSRYPKTEAVKRRRRRSKMRAALESLETMEARKSLHVRLLRCSWAWKESLKVVYSMSQVCIVSSHSPKWYIMKIKLCRVERIQIDFYIDVGSSFDYIGWLDKATIFVFCEHLINPGWLQNNVCYTSVY